MIQWRKTIILSLACLLVLQSSPILVSAETVVDDNLQAINDEIDARKIKIDQINSKIEEYQKKIDQAEAKQSSLANEIELLDNRAAQTELEIEATNEEISTIDAEMRVTDKSIAEATAALDREREMIASVLREMRVADNVSPVEWFFGSESFSDLFGRIEDLETLHSNLDKSLAEAQETKTSLQAYKEEQETRLTSLEELQKNLEKEIALLDNQRESKVVLIAETAESEDEFQALLNELLAEEQYVNRQIASLQSGIEEKLKENDIIGDSSVLSWPTPPLKGISATFHDPTYPFRHLFQHPGIDLPAPVGTPIKSVAPGYVAWVKQGRSYGNYVLIIHANGVATLYAHLSKILVETDQFVVRGETIGLSGGRPGDPGAGLSTGPHLHFEVRKDGVPTNPMDYLMAY